MSPTVCISFPSAPFSGAASALVGISAAAPAAEVIRIDTQAASCGQQRDWVAPLVELRAHAVVSIGTPSQLLDYQAFVRSRIQEAASLVASSAAWAGSGLEGALASALSLCNAGRATQARNAAVELIGFAQLALQLKCNVVGSRQFSAILNHREPGASSSGSGSGADSPPSSSSSGQSTGACVSAASTGSMPSPPAAFKVPAVPAKRQRSPEQQQPQAQAPEQEQQPAQLQQRRHSAPKRRATPQVLAAGPCDLAPAAPPASSTHGEACCDEQLLASWCPMSAKRQRASGPASPPRPELDRSSSTGSQDSSTTTAQAGAAAPPAQAAAAAPQQQQQQQPGVPPLPPRPPPSLTASARSGAVEALKRQMHADPAAAPAADVLLFSKDSQLPIVNWSGAIKHKAGGAVVEVCKVTLQVPEAFLEEFPGALYASDIRHRRSVSLGRHVVCRASLGTLTEHQLASLAAMARGQLVALCSLQTAELHLVPYFDNRNLVRVVGFLKIKAGAAA